MSEKINVGKVDYHFEIEDKVRGPPPKECHYPILQRVLVALRALRYGCPAMWTDDCARCAKRPVKSHHIEGISVHEAMARGMVTPQQVQQMIREARRKNGNNQE